VKPPAEPPDPDRLDECLSELGIRDKRILELVAEVEGLHAAMETRSVIEQAKGVIMSVMQCTPDTAFAVLVAQSQSENRKLHAIAAEIAERQEHR
jgi:AmiR/NasT family two-component response regulator